MSKAKKSRNISGEQGTSEPKSSKTTRVDGLFHRVSTLTALTVPALIIAFVLYSPALPGPFLFDDLGLPFYVRSFDHDSIGAWLAGVRPILMLSYWANFQMSGRDPWTYHAFNVILHSVNSILIFVLFSRIFRLRSIQSRRGLICAAIAALLFLVHPLQAESVAYIAGRSELVCGFFVLAALAVYSNPSIVSVSWSTSALVLFLYCCAVLSKEQAAVAPAAFLVIDTVLRGRSLREVWLHGRKLYGPIAVLGLLTVVGVVSMLARSSTAGFNVADVRWYEYLFTQFRVWLLYIGLAILPFRQNADYDLAVSRHLGDYGSGIALAGLIAIGLVGWFLRRRLPLLFAGLLIFAILLAPTSSLVPIQDLAAERRMYLPLLGLLLVLTQALVRWDLSEKVTAGVVAYLLVCAALTYDRAKVWSSDIAFWSDTTARSPDKPRGYTHLSYAYVRAHRCGEAVKTALRAPKGAQDTPEFLGMLGHAYACDQRINEAVNAFERAVLVGPSVGRVLALASTYRQAGRVWDAQAAEEQAMRLTPRTPYDFTMLDSFNKTKEQSRARSISLGR
jgi:protein O-mannosyl-transferase